MGNALDSFKWNLILFSSLSEQETLFLETKFVFDNTGEKALLLEIYINGPRIASLGSIGESAQVK